MNNWSDISAANALLETSWGWCFKAWLGWLGGVVVAAAIWSPLIVVAFAWLGVCMVQMVRYGRRADRIIRQVRKRQKARRRLLEARNAR